MKASIPSVLSVLFLLLYSLSVYAQQPTPCPLLEKLLAEAAKDKADSKYELALNKLNSARIAARNCSEGRVKDVDSKIDSVYLEIIDLKKKAENDRKVADQARKKALLASQEAIQAKKLAEDERNKSQQAAIRANRSAVEALEAKRKAVRAAQEADRAAHEADSSARITEASRLLAVASQVKEDDPTLALQLIKQACDVSYFNFKPAIETFKSIVSTTKPASFYLNKFEKLGEDVSSVALSENGKLLLVGSYADSIDVWDLTKTSGLGVGNPSATIKAHNGAILSLATSTDGSITVSGGTDGTIRVRRDTLEQNFAGHKGAVLSVAISANEQYLVSSGQDKMVKIWSLGNGILRVRDTLNLKYGNALQVCFSPDGKYIGIAGNDEVVRLWDWQSGKDITVLEGHLGAVRSVAFSPDGKYIVSGGDDKTVKVWDLKTSTIMHTLQGHQNSIMSVGFSADTNYVMSTSQDKTIKIWDWHNDSLFRELRGHQKAVFAAGFYKDSRYVYSGSYDGSVKLWDWKQENKLYPNFKFPELASSQDKELHQLQLSVGKRKIFSQNDTTLFSKCIVTQGADRSIWLWVSGTASKPVFIISTPDDKDKDNKLPEFHNNISIIKSTELYQAFYGKLIRANGKLIPVFTPSDRNKFFSNAQ